MGIRPCFEPKNVQDLSFLMQRCGCSSPAELQTPSLGDQTTPCVGSEQCSEHCLFRTSVPKNTVSEPPPGPPEPLPGPELPLYSGATGREDGQKIQNFDFLFF